jgi:hypothetical protein
MTWTRLAKGEAHVCHDAKQLQSPPVTDDASRTFGATEIESASYTEQRLQPEQGTVTPRLFCVWLQLFLFLLS